MLPSLTVYAMVLFTLFSPLGLDASNYAAHPVDESIVETALNAPTNLTVENIIKTDAYCSLDNGTAKIEMIGGTNPNYMYSIDNGLTFQTSNCFDNLGVGDYLVFVIDVSIAGCTATQTFQIGNAPDLEIIDFSFECLQGENSANFTMTVSGGTPEFTLSYADPNGGTYTTTSFNFDIDFQITDIVTGNYTVFIEDRLGCVKDTTFLVEECCTFDYMCNNPPINVDCLGDIPPIDPVYLDLVSDGYQDLDSLVSQQLLSITDNCYEAVVTAVDVPLNTPTTCQDTLKFLRTYTIDQQGVLYTCTQPINVLNHLPLELQSAAQDLALECDPATNDGEITAWLNNMGGATLVNDCNAIWVNDFVSISDACAETGATVVVFTVTDNCGNVSTTSAAITITDTTAPVILTPAIPLILDCGLDQTALQNWLATNGGATAEDVCGEVIWTNNFTQLNYDCGESGTTSVEFTATDECDNFVFTTGEITIVDPNAYQLLCPSDLDVDLDDPNHLTQIAEWLDLATTDDPCYAVDYPITNDFDPADLVIDCDYLSLTVTFSTINQCGVVRTCAAQIIAGQNNSSEIICLNDLELQCGDPDNEGSIQTWADNVLAFDADGNALTVSNDFDSEDLINFTCGELVITFSAIDDCNQTVVCQSSVIFEDDIAPEYIECPEDLNLACGFDQAVLDEWLNNTGLAVDACGSIVYSYEQSPDFVSVCGESGYIEVQFTATDECGNASTCDARVNIIDDTDIDIECPPNLIVDDSVTDFEAEVLAWIAMASVIDPCDLGLTVSNDYDPASIEGECGFISLVVNFEVSSACGPIASCSATISGNLNTDPTLECPEDITLGCGEAGNATAISDWVDAVTASDYLGNDLTVSNDLDMAQIESGCGLIEVTFSILDACDNELSCVRNIMIEDNEAPQIICTEIITIDLSQGSAENQLNNLIAETPLLDNCSNSISLEQELSGDASTVVCGDIFDLTLTATDACGNVTSCVTEVEFIDFNELLIECPDALSISCLEEDLEGQISAYLESIYVQSSRLEYTLENNYDSSLVADDCNDYISFEVEFIVYDDCGNEEFCSLEVEILPEMKVYVPNIFTPDGDGLNDLVTVYANKNVVRVNEFIIYDRWGEVVFRGLDFYPNTESFGWDGRFKGRMADINVYSFVTEVEDDFGRVETHTGTITLMN